MIKFVGEENQGEEVDDDYGDRPPEFQTPHLCPTCGGRPRAGQTKYGVRFSCCKNWAWGPHPLVDKETHDARKRAHEVFDELWQGLSKQPRAIFKRTSPNKMRALAYKRMSELLKIPPEKCHMKQMDAETARMVLVVVPRIKAEWREKDLWVDN